MQLKQVAVRIVAFCLFAFVQVAAAARPDRECELPMALQRQIVAVYPKGELVSMSDLNADDRGFFQKDHGDACPGLVKADFYGDGRPTLALVLIMKGGAKNKAKLVLAREVGGRWVTTVVDTADAMRVPVVWSQPPGQYRDVYGKREIRATKPVIVFSAYESWSILYAWAGTRFTKIWLRD